VAYSPSSGLPSRREERSAGQDVARGHPGGFPAGWFLGEEERDRPRGDALQLELAAWDAWDGAHRGEAADGAHLELRPQGADDAEKSAGREQDGRAPVEARWRLELRAAPAAAPKAAPAPYIRVAALSAARSCGAPVAAEVEQRPDAARRELPALRSWKAEAQLLKGYLRPGAALDAPPA